MITFQEIDEYTALYQAHKADPQLAIDARVEDLIPEGTKQKTNKKGVISWLDPVTKRSLSFANIHARNAWLVQKERQGVLKRKL